MTYSEPLYNLTINEDGSGSADEVPSRPGATAPIAQNLVTTLQGPGTRIHHIDWDRKVVVLTRELSKKSNQ